MSNAYLQKGWPRHEFDVLMRQYIERGKRLLPVWHGVTKSEIEAASPGLAGIFALGTDAGLHNVVQGLLQVITGHAATIARTSVWEDPLHRFLSGEGEATLLGGGSFTIWSALIHFGPDRFPLRVNDTTLSRDDLVTHATMNLFGDLSRSRMSWLRSIGYENVLAALRELGADLSMIAYTELPSH